MKKIAFLVAAALLLSSSCAGMFKTTAVAPGDYVIFHANQPFLYVITETSTGAVLFAGRYGAN